MGHLQPSSLPQKQPLERLLFPPNQPLTGGKFREKHGFRKRKVLADRRRSVSTTRIPLRHACLFVNRIG